MKRNRIFILILFCIMAPSTLNTQPVLSIDNLTITVEDHERPAGMDGDGCSVTRRLSDNRRGGDDLVLTNDTVKKDRGEAGAGMQDDHGGAGLGVFRSVQRTAGEWHGWGKRSPDDPHVYDILLPADAGENIPREP